MTDSLNIPTGLGRVGRELATGLRNRGYDIGYLGWHHDTDATLKTPDGIKFWYTNNKLHGQDALDQVVNKFQPDVVLTIGDFWHLWYINDPNVCRTRRFFQWCGYIAVDGEPLNGGLPPGIIPIIEDVDLPVAYTDYAKNAVLKSCKDSETRQRIETIYHGVDTDMFKPNPAKRMELRKKYGLEDKFMFLTVSRNQSRKNIPELFRAWKKFSEMPEFKDKVIFWPHMYFDDPMGWKIDDIMEIMKMRNNSIMYYDEVAHSDSELHLISDEALAEVYQIADAFILLSGEGFGLPTFEAMATKLPCILLDYAASSELGAEGRAELVRVENSFTWTGSQLTQRPIPDVDLVVQSMIKIYKDKPYRDGVAQKGYDFATKYTWKNVVDQWAVYFTKKEIPFVAPVEMEALT